jgi:hypothetical protein
MNANLIRHKVLEILSAIIVQSDVSIVLHNEETDDFAVSCEDLSKQIGCSVAEIIEANSVLISNKEIGVYNMKFRGCFATIEGVASYSTKKYLNTYKNNIKQKIKDFVQIFIPVISMLIALIAVSASNNQNEKVGRLENEIIEIKSEIRNIEMRLIEIETNNNNGTAIYHSLQPTQNAD